VSRVALLFALAGCGARWTSTDAANTRDATNLQAQLEVLCSRGDDAGTCAAPQVRALERAAWCATAGMAVRHGIAVADAGIGCVAP
jgi:hypothetical protein